MFLCTHTGTASMRRTGRHRHTRCVAALLHPHTPAQRPPFMGMQPYLHHPFPTQPLIHPITPHCSQLHTVHGHAAVLAARLCSLDLAAQLVDNELQCRGTRQETGDGAAAFSLQASAAAPQHWTQHARRTSSSQGTSQPSTCKHPHLHAVADAQHRDRVLLAVVEEALGDARSALHMHAVGASRQDDGFGVGLLDALLFQGEK